MEYLWKYNQSDRIVSAAEKIQMSKKNEITLRKFQIGCSVTKTRCEWECGKFISFENTHIKYVFNKN